MTRQERILCTVVLHTCCLWKYLVYDPFSPFIHYIRSKVGSSCPTCKSHQFSTCIWICMCILYLYVCICICMCVCLLLRLHTAILYPLWLLSPPVKSQGAALKTDKASSALSQACQRTKGPSLKCVVVPLDPQEYHGSCVCLSHQHHRPRTSDSGMNPHQRGKKSGWLTEKLCLTKNTYLPTYLPTWHDCQSVSESIVWVWVVLLD